MMSFDHVMRRTLSATVCLLLAGTTWAQTAGKQAAPQAAAQPAAQPSQFVDGIAAIVNKQVITLRQLEQETNKATAQLARQNIPAPEGDILRKQVLQRMITDTLLDQEAERLNIKVNDAQVESAVLSIARRNNLTPDQLRAEINKSGAQWEDYLGDLKLEIRNDQLRHRVVENQIMVSDAEVDSFLKNQHRGNRLSALGGAGQQAPEPLMLGLSQILVAVPEGASASQVAQLRAKAESLLQRLNTGADFAALAASASDGPEALKGGEMGMRPVDGWPDLFIEAVRQVPEGGVSGLIQSGNGFHIIKVVSRADSSPPVAVANQTAEQGANAAPTGPVMVTQTRARHILIKASPAMTEERAVQRLEQLRQRIEMGESFDDLARRYSEDASAPQGGDLGWATPGDMVPQFEQAMDALQPGQLSPVVQSPFGWHLIKVEERRTKDMEDEYRRMQARQQLFQRRAEPAFEEWLGQLHGQAFIDNRLEPQSRRRAR